MALRASWRRWAAAAALAALALAGCAPLPPLPDGGTVRMQAGADESRLPEALRGGPKLDGPPLRVLLRRSSQGLKISAPGGLRLRDPASGRLLGELTANGHARLGAHGGSLAYNGRSLGLELALVEPLRDGDAVKVAGKRYRGYLTLKAQAGALLLVNVVGLEDYLKGVLPGEIPKDWPLEAQKAQAVAARSFAVAHLGKARQDWDVDDSTNSQVYKGLDVEQPLPSRAVEETRGRVLSAQGKVIEAFFHSNSGGHTASAAEVWGGGAPWLEGVPDTWSEDQPHYAWKAVIPRETAERRLANAGLWKGLLEDVEGAGRTPSGRWAELRLSGGGRGRTVKANAFRMALGADRLRSVRFRVRLRGDDLEFDGVGWGHGVGLSQEGACAQARDGWTWTRILAFYYPGARLARLGP